MSADPIAAEQELQRIADALVTPARREPTPSSVVWESRLTLESRFGPLAYWMSGSGPTVLLVHGWESSHADLDAFVAPLLARGFRVVALDLPAHGESPGTRASMPDFGEAIALLGAHVGPLAGVIAHSAGCPSTAIALQRGLQVQRVALIATPERYDRFARWVASEAGVDGDALIAALDARGVGVASLVFPETAARLEVPALLVHSKDDRTCDVRGARAVAAAWRGSELLEVDGLGHMRILRDSAVVERVVEFVARAGQVIG
jgi:pimeloyl-ACP methyl ester carboxylesterase